MKPNQPALVAAHAWDIQGAKTAGLVTGWVTRRGKEFPPLMAQPDVRGACLEEVAEAFLALPKRRMPRRP